MTTDSRAAEPWKITLGELDEKMGVKIVEQSVDRVVATMPVEGNRQSFGLLHGGASLAVGEAVGSWAAVIHASTLGKTAVGIDVSATHHRSAREGQVTITATPIHLGGTLTTHEVLITNETGHPPRSLTCAKSATPPEHFHSPLRWPSPPPPTPADGTMMTTPRCYPYFM